MFLQIFLLSATCFTSGSSSFNYVGNNPGLHSGLRSVGVVRLRECRPIGLPTVKYSEKQSHTNSLKGIVPWPGGGKTTTEVPQDRDSFRGRLAAVAFCGSSMNDECTQTE